jgi:hypothetical protein
MRAREKRDVRFTARSVGQLPSRATELFSKGRTQKLALGAQNSVDASPAYLEIAEVALDGESENTILIVCP